MGTLIAELKQKANLKNYEQPLQDDRGYYYDHQPEGARIASIEDFYDDNEKLIIDKPYMVHSYVDPNRYWCKRVKSTFPYPGTDFEKFLNNNRIYVFA